MNRTIRFTSSAVSVAAVLLLAVGGQSLLRGAEPDKAVKLLNGKDLSGWHAKGNPQESKWVLGTAALAPEDDQRLKVTPGGTDLINAGGHGLDFYSDAKFGDAVIEVEVMVPRGSNSGIYVMGEYEIQVLDSFGRKEMGGGDMGAVYSAAPPRVNASKKPGEWQKFVIDYRAPKFDAEGRKVANARIVKITLNGKVIHENLELRGATPGGVSGKEAPTGPLMLQGNHGEVAYRNIKITPVSPK